MPRLAPLHWKKFEKFILYIGCHFEREEGDHRIYWRSDLKRPLVIPREDQLPLFIIRNNLRTLSITTKEYLDILKKL